MMNTSKLICFLSGLLVLTSAAAVWAVPSKYSTEEYVDGTMSLSSYEPTESLSSADVEFRDDGSFMLTVYSDRGRDVLTGWWDERSRTTASIEITEGVYYSDRGAGTAVFVRDRLRRISLMGGESDDIWKIVLNFPDTRDRINWNINLDIIIGPSHPDYRRYERYRIDRYRRNIPVRRDYPLDRRTRPYPREHSIDGRRDIPMDRPDGNRPGGYRPGGDGNRPPEVRPGRPGGNRPPEVRPGRPDGNRPPEVRPGRPDGNRPPEVRPDRPDGNRPPEVRPGRPDGNRPPEVRPGRPDGNTPPAVRPDRPNRDNPPSVQPGRLDSKQPGELRPGRQEGRKAPEVRPEGSSGTRPPEVRPSKPEGSNKGDVPLKKDKKTSDEEQKDAKPDRR